MGCPVVAYPAAGVEEVITHRESGELPRRNDWISLKESIQHVLQDFEYRQSLIENGRRNIASRFLLSRQAELVMAVFESMPDRSDTKRSRLLRFVAAAVHDFR